MAYPKNAVTPPEVAVGSIYLIADGSIVTSAASARVRIGTGAWGAAGGTLACDTTSGVWGYIPTQAETNAESFMVAVYKASCTSASVTVVTVAGSVAGKATLDATQGATTFASVTCTGAMTWGSWVIGAAAAYAGTVAFPGTWPASWPANWSWSTYAGGDTSGVTSLLGMTEVVT